MAEYLATWAIGLLCLSALILMVGSVHGRIAALERRLTNIEATK